MMTKDLLWRSKFNFFRVLLLMNLLLFVSFCNGASHGFGKDDISKVIKSQRDSIETFQFRFLRTQESLAEDNAPDGKADPTLQYLEQEEASSGNKLRFVTRSGNSDEKILEDKTSVWNGEIAKSLLKTAKMGYVDNNPNKYRLKAANTTLSFAMLVDTTENNKKPTFHKDIVAFLEHHYCVLEPETENIDGIECVVASMQYKGEKMLEVWLDPSRNFSVVQRVTYNANDSTKLLYKIHNLEFKDCGNGLWIPTKTEKTKYIFNEHPEEQWGTPSLKDTFVVEDIHINEELPEETFDIEFPDQILVFDKIADITYRTGIGAIDEMLDEFLDEFITLQKESNVEASKPTHTETAIKSNVPALHKQTNIMNDGKESTMAKNISSLSIINRASPKIPWARLLVAICALTCVLSCIAVIIRKVRMQKRTEASL